MDHDVRLIEAGFPCHQVGAETQRERGASSALPPLYYLHVWWARRPLTPSRAAILASLLPADTDPEWFLRQLGIEKPVPNKTYEWLGVKSHDDPELKLGIQKRLANFGRAAGQAQARLSGLARQNLPARHAPHPSRRGHPVRLPVAHGAPGVPRRTGA